MRATVGEDGSRVSYLKGAPEVLIARSTLDDRQKRAWAAKVISHATEGHRVVALAWSREESEEAVTFLGLVLLWDPPRAEVPDAIRRCKAAGIRVLMITGDHPATAATVGRSIGISTDRVLTGEEIDRLSPQELSEAARVVNVFARVTPEHKLRLVETLKDLGEIVAVTGDGVNDAPALKRSDVGIAMGRRGSDVSREVADVVLMDDNFATIVAAIEEGRNIYENIQKFIRFFFSTDLALILLMTAGLGLAFLLGIKDPAGGTFLLPLTAVQLLWINFVADGPPALAMALDRNPGVMDRPPQPPTAKLLDGTSLRFVAVSAAAKALVGVAIIAALPLIGRSLEETRTSLFLYESVLQLVFAYPARRIGSAALANVWVHLAVWLGIAVQALTLVVAPLRALLGLVPISGTVFAAIMLAALVTWGLAELPCRWAAGSGPTASKRTNSERRQND
jgi:Ca2+-transporting ATPase